MNRHADALSDFTECVQAALNRNAHKGELSDMTFVEISDKLYEEYNELQEELMIQEYPEAYNQKESLPQRVEREAADLAVCALAAFMWARERGRGADGISER